MGVPKRLDAVLTTSPYYRSTYVFVYRREDGLPVRSLDDPVLLEDQQLGELIMWVPAGGLYLCAALALCVGWLRMAERQVLRHSRGGSPVRGVWLSGLVALLIGLTSCNQSSERTAAALTGGNPGRGKEVIPQYGCDSCHTIPGTRGAHALVGLSLERITSRMYIAGVLPNTPENMLRWLQNPPAVQPFTAMSDMGVTETDARDIAGYLCTLR